MGLMMRAFSVKRASGVPTRSLSTLKGRPQISLPTELISTTNNIALTAPSVKVMQQALAESAAVKDNSSTLSSRLSSEDEQSIPETPSTPTSNSGSRRASNLSTGSMPSMTDNSSVSSSPSSPEAQFELPSRASFFAVDTFTKPSSTASVEILGDDSIDPFTIPVPVLPRRAPSHSKKEHERLARRRSQRTSVQPATEEIAVDEIFTPVLPAVIPEADEEVQAVEQSHPAAQEQIQEVDIVVEDTAQDPFSHTLEQLTEAVEELTALVEDEDTRIMRERGLKRWSVGGYLDIVGDAWSNTFVTYSEVIAVA